MNLLSGIEAGTKECVVRISGGEKKHVAVALSGAADGTMLPPMIIFLRQK